MKKLTFLSLVVTAIAACSSQQSSQTTASANDASTARVLTIKEYYDDDAARGEAIEHCSASNEAQVDANLKKPECKNALDAQTLHDLGRKPE